MVPSADIDGAKPPTSSPLPLCAVTRAIGPAPRRRKMSPKTPRAELGRERLERDRAAAAETAGRVEPALTPGTVLDALGAAGSARVRAADLGGIAGERDAALGGGEDDGSALAGVGRVGDVDRAEAAVLLESFARLTFHVPLTRVSGSGWS